jgi:hypothetical protein
VEYLTGSVPRTGDGAISHRPPGEAVQLWCVSSLFYLSVVCSDLIVIAQS